MKKAKENWLNNECKDIDNSFASNRSKKAYSIIKALTKKKSETINTILNKDGKVLVKIHILLKDGLNTAKNYIIMNPEETKMFCK